MLPVTVTAESKEAARAIMAQIVAGWDEEGDGTSFTQYYLMSLPIGYDPDGSSVLDHTGRVYDPLDDDVASGQEV